MEKRSRRRTRDLVTQAASQGLSQNEIGCARISMMARSTNAPCKGRIQMRKTNHLQIIKSSLQRTAGLYKSANKKLVHCSKSVPIFASEVQARMICSSVSSQNAQASTWIRFNVCNHVLTTLAAHEYPLPGPWPLASRRFRSKRAAASPTTLGRPLVSPGRAGMCAVSRSDLASSLESLGRFGSVIWASVWTCDQLEYGKVGVFHPIL